MSRFSNSSLSRLSVVAAALAMSASLSGCIVVGANVHDGDWDDDAHLVRLLGAEVDARAPEVTITASSNGCTEKSQFAPLVDRRGDNRYSVGFRRTVEDRCKALMAEGKRMTWTFSELGIPAGSQVVVRNRIGR
ncbi:MAG: hypothetical protein GC155_03600 [Alphaproteobacteria bacterium]|nr:hypothetical protein [Alphaproteobacteria bacterium]